MNKIFIISMKLTKDQFKGTMLRNENMKIDIKDMKAHQAIIGDNTFKKSIKKEEKKKNVADIEDIFEKGGKKKIDFSISKSSKSNKKK